MKYKILFIFILALLVRLIAINQSLWLDEATTAKVVQEYGITQIVSEFSPRDFHPPLYYLLMKVWTDFAGYSEVSLRFPSLFFSLLAGYFVYKIALMLQVAAGRLGGQNVAMWSAVLFLFNPLIVYYSQEARMYTMATFFVILSFFYLLKILKENNNKNILLFSLSTSLAFLTFYGTMFYIISVVSYLIYKKELKTLSVLLFVIAIAFFVVSPLLFQQFNNAKAQLNVVPNWSSVLGKANLKNLLLIPLKFSAGRISFEPKLIYWSLAGFWTAAIVLMTTMGGFKNKLPAYFLTFPLVLGMFFSFFTPLLQYFRFLYLIPFFSLLVASGSFNSRLKGIRWIVMTGFLAWSMLYIFNPTFHREDWKSLTKDLPLNSKVFMIASSLDPVRYYRKDLRVTDLKSLPEKIAEKKLFVIPYTADIHGVDYVKNLESRKFRMAKKTSFRELTLEQWVR